MNEMHEKNSYHDWRYSPSKFAVLNLTAGGLIPQLKGQSRLRAAEQLAKHFLSNQNYRRVNLC